MERTFTFGIKTLTASSVLMSKAIVMLVTKKKVTTAKIIEAIFFIQNYPPYQKA
jgi:hypothetical protein